MNRDTYIALHSKYEKKAFIILRKHIKKIIAKIPLDNLTALNAEATVLLNFDKDAIDKAYIEMYTTIGLMHGKFILKDIENQTKAVSFFETLFRDTLFNWMAQNVGQRIISVNTTLAKTIIDIINQSFNNELNIIQIRNLIQNRLNLANFYRWQALRIVRTETTTISNYSAFKASESSNLVLDKEWVSIQDTRTRRQPDDEFDHLRMNGVKVPYEQEFFVNGDLILYPGDPTSVFAGNIINCRCTFNLVPRRDANGMLIRKT